MVNKYSFITRLIHWLSALIVVFLFALGWWMSDLDYYDSWYQKAPDLHISIGLIFIVVFFARIVNRLLAQAPPSLTTWRRSELLMAKLVHGLFYVFMILMACTGYLLAGLEQSGVAFFNLFTLPSVPVDISAYEDLLGEVHEIIAYTFIIVAVGHGFFALKHHFYDKDVTLKRMLPW